MTAAHGLRWPSWCSSRLTRHICTGICVAKCMNSGERVASECLRGLLLSVTSMDY
jgi:hypothetical protein